MAVAATTIPITLAATGCSCSNSSQEQQEEKKEKATLTSIDVQLPTDTIELYVNGSETTDPIEVSCYDQYGHSIESSTKLDLSSNGDSITPEWITISDDNRIEINNAVNPGLYEFNIQAYSEDRKVHSDIKTLYVKVNEIPIVAPDRIEVFTDVTSHQIMTTDNYYFGIDSSGTKEGYDPKYVDQSVTWSIEFLESVKTTDLYGNNVFNIGKSAGKYICKISTYIDSTYVGKYKFKIIATSKKDTSISGAIEITVDLIDGLNQTVNNYTYTRKYVSNGWTLTNVPEGANYINIPSDTILSKPVVAIGDDICTNCKITKLCEVTGPETITEVGYCAFKQQDYLTKVSLPGLTKVNSYAFYESPAMYFDQDAMPNLTYVGNYSFVNCKALKLTGQNNFTNFGDYAFYGSGIDSIIVGDKMKYIPDSAFANCSNLKTFTLTRVVPPSISGGIFTQSPIETIYVPLGAAEVYKTDTNWAVYADLIAEKAM